jgi:hypothetical protein
LNKLIVAYFGTLWYISINEFFLFNRTLTAHQQNPGLDGNFLYGNAKLEMQQYAFSSIGTPKGFLACTGNIIESEKK